MNTKLLRQKILDLAIRGKLTDQRKSDGTARELLEQISASRQPERSTKSAKSKDPTPIIPLNKSEAPFEIPNSWEWVKLGDVFNMQAGKNIAAEAIKKEYEKGLFPCYGGNGLRGYVSYYNREGDFPLIGRQGALCGNINRATGKFYATEHAVVVEVSYGMNVPWACFFLIQLNLNQYASSTAQPGLSVAKINEVPIPLPPLAEQQRIVAKIEEAFAEIDAVEKNKELLKTHIKQTRQKILDLAIHGKLVPQDENDEPASVLLEKILQEKVQSDNKKSPKKKKTNDITTSDNRPYKKNDSLTVENTPFEIPDSWEWTQIGDICDYGECENIEVKDISDDAWVLELEDIEKDSGRIINFITKKERQINGVRHSFKEGDVLYSKLRTYLNKVLVAPQDGFCTTEIMPIKADHLLNHYLNIVLRSQYFLEYTSLCGYGVKMPRLSTADAKKALIPLPPLAEQKRIASKIESLFSVLDAMEEECD